MQREFMLPKRVGVSSKKMFEWEAEEKLGDESVKIIA